MEHRFPPVKDKRSDAAGANWYAFPAEGLPDRMIHHKPAGWSPALHRVGLAGLNRFFMMVIPSGRLYEAEVRGEKPLHNSL